MTLGFDLLGILDNLRGSFEQITITFNEKACSHGNAVQLCLARKQEINCFYQKKQNNNLTPVCKCLGSMPFTLICFVFRRIASGTSQTISFSILVPECYTNRGKQPRIGIKVQATAPKKLMGFFMTWSRSVRYGTIYSSY